MTTTQQRLSRFLFLEEKDKLFIFQKKIRWLWTSFYRLVLQQDLPSKIWVVKGRGLQTEHDWYERLDAIDTMIHQLKNILNKPTFSSITKIPSLMDDIEKNLLLLQTLMINRIPSSQRLLEQYFLETGQQKQRQYKKRRLTKGIRF